MALLLHNSIFAKSDMYLARNFNVVKSNLFNKLFRIHISLQLTYHIYCSLNAYTSKLYSIKNNLRKQRRQIS